MALAPLCDAAAQHSSASDVRSAKSGVYTSAQALRGRDLYALQCRSCHTPESHTGVIFDTWWGGKLLSDLFEYVQERMPKNEPGSLTPQEYADVVAYLLRMNAMPSGTEELSTDVTALKKIRIEKAK
jgi:mono/diheme cytochrome c family protein